MGDMTTIRTCHKCGLVYRESLIPHQCAEWTKGRAPRIACRCPNCGQVDAHAEQCPSNPARYEHEHE